MNCMVSYIPRPDVTRPPGELMYMAISFFGFSDLRQKKLRNETRRGHVVLNDAGEEDDALLQKPRIDIESALTTVGLFDYHGNKLGWCRDLTDRAYVFSLA